MRKILFAGIELTSQRVRGLQGTSELPGRPALYVWSSYIARVWINRVPGQVANPARGQLNRENKYFYCPRSRLRIWSRETGWAVSSRVSLLITILRLNLVLTYEIPPEFRGVAHLFIQTAIRHRAINCVPMASTAESPPAQGQ